MDTRPTVLVKLTPGQQAKVHAVKADADPHKGRRIDSIRHAAARIAERKFEKQTFAQTGRWPTYSETPYFLAS